MPDISKLTMPNGIEYNIKDSQARKDIEKIKKSGGGSSGGSGLPDASEYKDGTALIAIDGEFVPAEGYGYLGEQKEVHWDGKYHADEFEVIDGGEMRIYMKKIQDEFVEVDSLNLTIYTSDRDPHIETVNRNELKGESNEEIIVARYGRDFGLFIIYNSPAFWSMVNLSDQNTTGTYLIYTLNSNHDDIPADGEYMSSDFSDVSDLVWSWSQGLIKIDEKLYDKTQVKYLSSYNWSNGSTRVGDIFIDGNSYTIYVPKVPSISITRNQTTGTKIGTIKLNNTDYDLYAPTPTSVTVTPSITSGTKIASINNTDLFIPNTSSGLISVYNYRNIKRILANDDSATVFPLWSQIAVPHKEFGTIIFDVVNYNEEDKALTLFMTDCIAPQYEFDAAESDNPDGSRKHSGSNNYGQSAVRQWLNATAESNWWQAKTEYDVAPSYANKPGFLAGFPSDFINILSPTERKCATNRIVENGSVDGTSIVINSEYTINDLMFLPSYTELTGENNNNIAEGTQFQVFQKYGTTASAKYDILIKRNIKTGENQWYWQRSCIPDSSGRVRGVYSYGHPGDYGDAMLRSGGFAAACVIKA